jgi:hypothetical protein
MVSRFKITPFVAPFAVFMLFLVIVDGSFPDEHYLLYPLKSVLVGAIIACFWRALPSLRPVALWGSVVVGVAGVALWVGLDGPATQLDVAIAEDWNRAMSSAGFVSWQVMVDPPGSTGLNPFALYPAAEAWVLFGFRVAGIALVVPVMEELFWRGFLMRWLIQEDFAAVPLGTYGAFSFWVTTLCFASVHGSEWPQGLVVGVIYGAWFVRTKNLGSIMLAHGVTNLLLALYCLISGDWHFLSTAHAATPPK